jgi:7-cyano-7-deazaguanine synthase in queuosine biosynthesis
LWRVAQAVYLADRLSAREKTSDRWTRTIALSVQVTDPQPWSDQFQDLNDLLQVLTGDMWQITLHDGAVPIDDPLDLNSRPTEVALFSGGLDSTAYAAEVVSGHTGNALFICYDQQALKTPQGSIFDEIRKLAPSHRVDLRQTRLRPKSPADTSNRSRGLLFITTAVCAAAAHQVPAVMVPENGQLALNPAITSARLAACSTRSVHPWTLYMLNRLISRISGNVIVKNPYIGLTKGEVCERARDSGLTAAVFQRTISCGHPGIAQSKGTGYNCGYCFPCLVRRSGLHKALQTDPTPYLLDIADLDPFNRHDKKTIHLHDLLDWLATDFTFRDVVADAPLPPDLVPSSLMPVLHRGRHELVEMIEDLMPADSPFRRTWQPRVSAYG